MYHNQNSVFETSFGAMFYTFDHTLYSYISSRAVEYKISTLIRFTLQNFQYIPLKSIQKSLIMHLDSSKALRISCLMNDMGRVLSANIEAFAASRVVMYLTPTIRYCLFDFVAVSSP